MLSDECGMMSDECEGRPAFLIHHSSFRIHHFLFECSRDGARFEHERDFGDFAALTLADEVEEYGRGRAVAVPDVARAHALAERVASGLGGRGAVEDLHFG